MSDDRRRETTTAETRSTCDGEGRVADSADQEPWSTGESITVASAAAVISRLMRPISCSHRASPGAVTGPASGGDTTRIERLERIAQAAERIYQRFRDDWPGVTRGELGNVHRECFICGGGEYMHKRDCPWPELVAAMGEVE